MRQRKWETEGEKRGDRHREKTDNAKTGKRPTERREETERRDETDREKRGDRRREERR